MRNNIKKFLSVFIVFIMCFNSTLLATSIIPSEIGPEMPGDKPTKFANNVIGSMKWIGVVIAIGMIMYVGIKYVMSSADEKASMKGLLVKVVIGALIIAFANAIVNMVLNVAGA